MNRVQTVISEGGEFRFTPETIHQIPFPASVQVFGVVGEGHGYLIWGSLSMIPASLLLPSSDPRSVYVQ